MNTYRLLVVEDHADTAQILQRVLVREGHEVHVAMTCAETVELCRGNKYDLLLVDLSLPDGDGKILLQRLLNDKPVRAVAISGYATEEDVRGCLDAGFVAHVAKPHTFQKLLETIQQAMKVEMAGTQGAHVVNLALPSNPVVAKA